MYFQVNAKFDRIQENGAVKKVSEPYLVDAVNFTDVEARANEELAPFMSGEFELSAAKRTKIVEVFEDYEGDRYYSVVSAFICLDEKTATKKRNKVSYLVKAIDFRNALENFIDAMKGTLADFEIVSINETAIMDVFHVKTEEE